MTAVNNKIIFENPINNYFVMNKYVWIKTYSNKSIVTVIPKCNVQLKMNGLPWMYNMRDSYCWGLDTLF